MMNSMPTSPDMVTELKMLLSLLKMLLVFMKEQSKEVLKVLWSQLNLKMKMVLLSCIQSKLMVTLLIHSSKEKTIKDTSYLTLPFITLKKFITI